MQLHRFQRLDVFVSFLIIVVISTSEANRLRSGTGSQQNPAPTVAPGATRDLEAEARLARRSRTTSDTDEENVSDDVRNGSSSSANCTQCSIREVKRSYRIEAIKADILRKLRLSNPPNVTGRRLPDIPQLQKIMEHYTFQNDSPGEIDQTRGQEVEVDDSYATTIKVIVFAQPAPPVVAGNTSNVFNFNFTTDMTHQQIVNATLGVFIRRPEVQTNLVNTWILIYRLGRLPAQDRLLISRKKINLNELFDTGQWFTFNMKSQVESWVSHVNTPYGIVVQASDGRGEPLAIISPRNQDEEVLKPYLEILVRDQGTSRPKRMIDLDCDENSAENLCCRYPLTVDFELFRWDWVIVPKRYSAYYCSGECPFYYYQRYPHTNLAAQANRVPGTAGSPCCSPRKVSAISMLYYDDYMNIVYGRLPGMVVDQCGCS